MSAERFEHLPRKEKEGIWRELALVRDEIPLITEDKWPGRNPKFIVPIHPLVIGLPEEIRFDPKYAERVWGLVWEWAKDDIERFISDIEREVGFEEKKDLERLIGKGEEHWRFKNFSPQNLLLSAQCHDAYVYACRFENTPEIRVPQMVRFRTRDKMESYAVMGEVVYKGEEALFYSSAFLSKNADNVVQGYLLLNLCRAYHNQLLKVALGL